MKSLITTLFLIFQASRCLAVTGVVTTNATLEGQFNGTISVNNLSTSVTGTSGGSVKWNLSSAAAGDVVYALTGGAYVKVGTVAASPAPSATGLTLTTAYNGTSLSAVNFVIIPKSGTITVEDATLTLSFSQTITDSMICNFVLGKGSGAKSGSVNVNHSTLSLIPTAVTLAVSAGLSNNITLTSGFLKWRSGVSSAPPAGCSYTYSGGTVVFYPFGGTVGGPFNLNGSSFSSLTIEASSTTSYNAQSAISVSGVLTIPTQVTLNMAANTLTLSAAGTTLTNGGTISTTATPTWISDSRSPGAGTYSGTITFAGTSAQTIQTGTYTNLTVSGAGVKTIASAVTVSKILTTAVSGGAVSIISSGSLTLSGSLSGAERHVIGGPIECNGGDFIVTGNKDQGTGVPPFMFISSSITDISSAGAGRVGCIQFKPSNTGNLTSKRSVIRFVGSSLSLGNTTGAGDRSIVTNDRAYFEVGDGSTTTSLTLNDTLCIFNGIRLRSSSTLSSNGKLKLGSSVTNKFGGSSFNGYMDTVDATGTLPVYNGNISLIMTMEGSRKFRFLGNPFSGSLNITDFTDDIDITGTIGTNTNNFTSTNTNSPSAFLYTTSSNSWTALTSSSPTSLSSLEGLRVLVRGAKGEGLTVGSGSYTPSVARIQISGAPILGNKTISNLAYNSSNSNGYNLVTNPLLGPVDLSLLYNAVGGGSGSGLTNVSSTVTVYTPSLSGMKTYDLSNGNWSGGGSTKGDVWLPGSSIIFQVTSATNSILVEDLDKLTPLGRTYTSMFAELDSVKNIGQFLISRDNGRLSLTDGVSLDFGNRKEANDSYNFGIDAEDFGTDSVNLSLISPEGKYLAISKTNSLNVNDIRRYPMSVSIRNSSLNGNYKIAFELFKAFEPGYQIILLDKYLNISTDLFMNPSYDFKISDDLNSKGDNRFEIVVSKSQLGIDDIVNSKVVDFFINQDLSQNVLSFSFTGTSSNHELLIFDVQGKQVYFRDCQKDSVVLPSDKFKPGVYFASVRSGEVTKTKKFVLIY